MYQKKWDGLLGKAAKCPRCFFDIELDGEKVAIKMCGGWRFQGIEKGDL